MQKITLVKITIILLILFSLTGTALANETKEKIQMALAEAYMIDKDYDNAIAQYQNVLQSNPQNVAAHLAIADILSWQKKYDESIKEFKKALSLDANNLKIKKKLATVYTWKNDFNDAEQLYKDLLKSNPNDIDTCTELGKILSWQGKNEEARHYLKIASTQPKNKQTKLLYGKTLLFSGDYINAKKIFNELITTDPSNREAKLCLADTFAYNKEFPQAITYYQELLKEKPNLEIKRKLADTLSWNKQYPEALTLYNEILAEKEDNAARLQKARILGWSKQYQKAIKTYQKILTTHENQTVRLEMESKEAYWNHRLKKTIHLYEQLIHSDPANVEAMFDLSQVYAYQSMWPKALDTYQKILAVSPNHFRAKEGLKKAELIATHYSLNSGYEFFEANSPGRQQDVKRHGIINRLSIPLTYHFSLNLEQKLNYRTFSDFGDLVESQEGMTISYINTPAWKVSGFYKFIDYNKHVSGSHLFGLDHYLRISDTWTSNISFKKNLLENSSTVIRGRVYSDCYKGRFEFDINHRLKFGVDYSLTHYSNNNNNHEPGLDVLYYFSLDPKRLSLMYRYFYQNFDKQNDAYFSPKGFSTNSLTINWRHFLNKEEIFFGADNFYYDLAYQLSVDSKNIVSHKFSAELSKDINKQFNFTIKASFTETSASVYEDKHIIAFIKYYF